MKLIRPFFLTKHPFPTYPGRLEDRRASARRVKTICSQGKNYLKRIVIRADVAFEPWQTRYDGKLSIKVAGRTYGKHEIIYFG